MAITLPRMDARNEMRAFFAGGDREFLPHLSVDCAILGFHAGELKVLLLRWQGAERWSLPGGFVRHGESLDDAAARVLRERTGLDRIYLQQFHAFGGLQRDENALRPSFESLGIDAPADHWLLRRVVAVAYVALVDFNQAAPTPDHALAECRWWDLDAHPPLMFDHDEIVSRALATVRRELESAPIAASLLPEKFTMPELQRLYETLLGKSLDRRNFQKWIRERGLVERLDERKTGRAHRAPYLYRFVLNG